MDNFVDYNRSAEIIEITIRDRTKAKIETKRANSFDKKEISKIVRYFSDKYGIDFTPEISVKESINAKKNEWLDPNSEFLKW